MTAPTPWHAIASPRRHRPGSGAELVTPAQQGNAQRRRDPAAQVGCLADELAAAIAKGLVLGLPIPGRAHGAWLAVEEWADLLGRSQPRTDQPRGRDHCCPAHRPAMAHKGDHDVAAR